MGSFAGVLAGIGGEVQRENLEKLAVEHEANNHMADQLEKMAESARPEFAQDLLNAAFQIRTTPPGKKPPKEATDLKALMARRLAQQIQSGGAQVQVPTQNVPKPPVPAEVVTSNVVPDTGPSQAPNYFNAPWLNQPEQSAIPAPPVNLQPGSDAPGPVSGTPSPGFGADTSSQALPLPPTRQPNQFTMNGEQYGYYKNIAPTPEEVRQQEIADMEALRAEAVSILGRNADPADIANFIRNKEVHGGGGWSSAGQGVIFNSRTGEWKAITGNDLIHLPPGTVVYDPHTKQAIYQAPFAPKEPTSAFGVTKQKLESELGRELTSKEAIELNSKLQSGNNTLHPVVEGKRIVYRYTPNAEGKDVPRTLYDEAGTGTTGGVRGITLTPPPPVANAAQEQLTGIKNAIDQFAKVDELLKNPKFSTKGPGLGQITMAQFNQGGGAGLSPEEREMATRLSTLLTTQAFQNGGKQLTEPELGRFKENTPREGDTLANAITKTKIALEILRQNYNNRRSMLGARQQGQVPALDSTTSGGIPPPPGRIRFRDRATGRTGTVDAGEFDPNTMEQI